MVQPSVYSKEQIVDAAFEIVRDGGWSAVSARAIAKRLGSSTMPIYSHTRSMDDLENALREKARQTLHDFQHRQYTEFPLLNVAFGYIAFARDERHLFRFLFLEKPDALTDADLGSMRDFFTKEFGDQSDENQALSAMSPESQEALVRHTWVFTHGLASLVNAGTLGDISDTTILEFLQNAGEAFYIWASTPRQGGTS